MRRHKLLLATLAVSASAAVLPTTASAAVGWRCEASAISGTVLGIQLPSVRANAGADGCKTQTAGGALKLPLPLPVLEANAISAATSLTGSQVADQKILAAGGIADVRLKALPDLPVQLPEIPLPAGLRTLNVDLSSITGPLTDPLNLLPDNLTLDLGPAIDAINRKSLPNTDLLRVQAAVAYAGGQCVNGQPRVSGASQLAGITVLGKELPTNQIAEQTVSLIDTENIDLSNLPIDQLGGLDLGLLQLPLLGDQVRGLIQGALDALPPISIPATLAHVKVTPGAQTTENGMLVQRALRAQVSIAGQSIADIAIGDARAGAGDVLCEAPALACTDRRLVLIDVLPDGDRVKLIGAADRAFVGQTVDIFFDATKEVVATAKVRKDGSFQTTSAMPGKGLRATNLARYRAVLNDEESLNLKLMRRMVVKKMTSRGGKVTITGYVVKPLAKPVEEILVTRRVSCHKKEVVGTVMPKRDGSFSVTVDAPQGVASAVYRLSTRVRKTRRNPKTFPTYTLPRAVNINR